MNNRPIDRLDFYLSSKGIKRSNAEKTLGIANGYIRNQLTKQGTIGTDILEKILDNYLDLDIIWLITGRGEMYSNNKVEQIENIREGTPTWAKGLVQKVEGVVSEIAGLKAELNDIKKQDKHSEAKRSVA